MPCARAWRCDAEVARTCHVHVHVAGHVAHTRGRTCPLPRVRVAQVIWAIVNAVDRGTSAEDKHNKGKFLNRQEFMQALVRAAINVYVQRGPMGDVSDAVNRLMVSNLYDNLHPYALQNSNAFRKRFCYIEPTSLVIEANLSSLSTLYEKYAEVSNSRDDVLRNDALMSIGEWVTFCRHLGLIESGLLTTALAKYIFIWCLVARTLEPTTLSASLAWCDTVE